MLSLHPRGSKSQLVQKFWHKTQMGRLLINDDPCNSSVKSLCSSSMLQNWVTCHSAVAAKHWNPRQRRKKEKAIRIFGDFLYCALCTTSLWTEMKNQRWKLFGIEILLQNIILAHHLASFWILRRFQIWPKLTPMGCLHQGEIKRRSLTWYTAHSLCPPFAKVGPY